MCSSDLTTIGASTPTCALAARLALRTGDRARHDRIVAMLTLPGGASDVDLALLEGTRHAVDGRVPDAIERFRWRIETARSYGLRFGVAWAGLAMAEALPPDTPGLATVVAETRAILDDLGAVMLLRRLDAVAPSAA